MAWIQLQHQNGNDKHLGGLYVNTNHIAAVYRSFNGNDPIFTLQLVSGDEFHPVQSMMEVLDMIVIAENQEKGNK